MSALPKPTSVTACPGLRMSVSQPIKIGVIGTLVTGEDSLHTAKSLPLPGLPPGMTLQELGVTVLAGA